MAKSKIILDRKKIREEVVDLKKALLNLKFQKSTGQLEKTSEIKNVRHKIARLKTQISKEEFFSILMSVINRAPFPKVAYDQIQLMKTIRRLRKPIKK